MRSTDHPRVLRNLIENALRYTGSGGTVTVSAAPAAHGAVLEVVDSRLGGSRRWT